MDNPAPPPPLAGHYELLREIGRGRMATVFQAQDLEHDRPVAVKILAHRVVDPGDSTRVHREIAIIARFQHPHIVPLFARAAS
ncbi:MAG: protein kinase domain-containing protein [Gemmatimonadaceae bacterium]